MICIISVISILNTGRTLVVSEALSARMVVLSSWAPVDGLYYYY